jgi:hypothetical protein
VARVRVVKPSGLYWLDPPRACGEVFETDDAHADRLVAARHAVAVEEEKAAPPPAVEAAKNRAYTRGKKK